MPRVEGRGLRRGYSLPGRLRRLLWVLCVNGALLALEGALQRGSGTNKLLWLVEPRLNQTPDSQFGPYAYRSNGAQYLTLLWPLALSFWWISHQASKSERRSRSRHHVLISCALVMAAGPLISLSRAGAAIGLAGIVVAALILVVGRREMGWKGRLGLTALLGVILLLAWYVVWPGMTKRLEEAKHASQEARLRAWGRGIEIARDYPVFGTGPNTFEPVFQFYSPQVQEEDWPAQLHNDWLETLITFGWVGTSLVLLLLTLVVGQWFLGGGIGVHRVFVLFLWLGMGGCLAHGLVDFPFQIYSILFLFILLSAVLSCMGRPRTAGGGSS
jgi:O-antigen ligase